MQPAKALAQRLPCASAEPVFAQGIEMAVGVGAGRRRRHALGQSEAPSLAVSRTRTARRSRS
jgi:hypothetical protein